MTLLGRKVKRHSATLTAEYWELPGIFSGHIKLELPKEDVFQLELELVTRIEDPFTWLTHLNHESKCSGMSNGFPKPKL